MDRRRKPHKGVGARNREDQNAAGGPGGVTSAGAGAAGEAVSADEFARAMRVGGVLRRVGVPTVAASGHTLAVTPGGVVLSWGRDWDARRRVVAASACRRVNGGGAGGGGGDRAEDGFRPGLVGGLLAQERVLAIVAGRYFTLAITQHGRLFTWGANLYTGDAPWRHEHDSGFDDDADAAADEFPEKAPAGTARPGAAVVEVDVGTDHWVALTGPGMVLVCHTGFTPQGIWVDTEQHRSWLGVAPGVPLDRPAAVRVPPHLGSHPGGGEQGRAAGPEVQLVAAAHHTTFAVTADYKAVSWGEAGPLLGRAWGEVQGQVPANRPGVVGSGGGGGGAVGGEGVVGLDRQTVEQVSAGEGFAVARLSHGVVYSCAGAGAAGGAAGGGSLLACSSFPFPLLPLTALSQQPRLIPTILTTPLGDNQHGQLGRPAFSQDDTPAPVHGGDNQHGQLGRPAPPQDGTPAPVQGLEHLEVLLVVAGSQQGLVLCRALQGSEAALEPQEFDDTRVLNEEHVSPATLPDPDASAPAAAVSGAVVGAVVRAGGMGGGLDAAGEAAGAVAGGGVGSAGDKWPERVGGGASAEEQGGTGGEGAVARDMWMKFGEEFKMLPWQGMDSSMRNPCWRVAGTQDLYRKLTSSIIPGIFPAAIPNPQWWDRNGARDFAWYVSLFDEAAQHMVNTGGSVVTGEASSTLLTSSGVVLRGHVDGRHTVPQLLHLVLPRSKFIVILRNPVDRFFSEFNLAAAVNPSPSVPSDFHKYVSACSELHRMCMHRMVSLRHSKAQACCLPFTTSPSPPQTARDATARMSACVEKEGAHACVRKLFRDMPDLCGSFYAYFIQDWFLYFHPQDLRFLHFKGYTATTPTYCTRPLIPSLPLPICHSLPPVFLLLQDWFHSFHFQAFLFLQFEDYMANPHRATPPAPLDTPQSPPSTPTPLSPPHLQDWFRSFHPQAFLFLRFEDYMANPRPHIAQILDFLGFPAADVAEEKWAGIVDLERVEQRPEGMAREELDGVTREYLEAFFAPFNADLVRLLWDEKYSWKRGQR
ncbi:unnamed protein product [Closterium sp. NIES-64]|nr:unnamed protein product [Closterium sp. NIES-64]